MIKQYISNCKSTWGWLQAIINTLNYQKILEILLKLCPTLNCNPINIKILIISGTPIWVIFQNSVTFYMMFGRQGRMPLDIMFDTSVMLTSMFGDSRNHCKMLMNWLEIIWKGLLVEKKNYMIRECNLVWFCSPAVPQGQARKLFCPWRGPFNPLTPNASIVALVLKHKSYYAFWQQNLGSCKSV